MLELNCIFITTCYTVLSFPFKYTTKFNFNEMLVLVRRLIIYLYYSILNNQHYGLGFLFSKKEIKRIFQKIFCSLMSALISK